MNIQFNSTANAVPTTATTATTDQLADQVRETLIGFGMPSVLAYDFVITKDDRVFIKFVCSNSSATMALGLFLTLFGDNNSISYITFLESGIMIWHKFYAAKDHNVVNRNLINHLKENSVVTITY
jgi:hypothetical protein